MIESTDLDAAVRSGVITPDVADRLRNFSAEQRGTPAASEERFGLVGGLADIMSATGIFLLLGAGLVGLTNAAPMANVVVACAAWGLAEYFTRRRKLTLTSFALFALFDAAAVLAFLGVAMLLPNAHPATAHIPFTAPDLSPVQGLIVAAGATLASAAWWLRFRLPLAYTAAAVAGLNASAHVLRLVAPGTPAWAVAILLLLAGVAIFLVAMWWDLSDIRRETIRSDVAFWLHVAAGYQIAHSSFRLLYGVVGNPVGWERLNSFDTPLPQDTVLTLALILFVVFCVVGLAIDRRSLLMSSLIYMFPALGRWSGVAGMGGLLAGGLMLGALLLALASGWTQLRVLVLSCLPPALRAQLPRTSITNFGSRPVH